MGNKYKKLEQITNDSKSIKETTAPIVYLEKNLSEKQNEQSSNSKASNANKFNQAENDESENNGKNYDKSKTLLFISNFGLLEDEEYAPIPFYLDDQSLELNKNFISLFGMSNVVSDELCGLECLWLSSDKLGSMNEFENYNDNLKITNDMHEYLTIDKEDDLDDIRAYLYEIDTNLEYFKNEYIEIESFDLIYCNSELESDGWLRFKCKKEACNILLHEIEISNIISNINNSNINNKFQLADLISRVDCIPEFIPINPYQNCFTESVEVENVKNYVGPNSFNEIIEKNQLDINDNEDFSGANDENIGDDFYSAFNNGGDIFENVYNYVPDEETNDIYSNQNNVTAPFIRKKLNAILDLENSSSSSSASSLNTAAAANNVGSRLMIPRLLRSMRDMFRKPCVYMLNEGRCMRTDCRFAHDLHNIICKYWLEGECLKGESCEFLHDFPTNSISPHSNSSDSQKAQSETNRFQENVDGFSLNTLDFPELNATLPAQKQLKIYDDNKTSISNQISINSCNDMQKNPMTDKVKPMIDIKSDENAKTIFSTKKSRKLKDNILYSLSLPALATTSRKKNIN